MARSKTPTLRAGCSVDELLRGSWAASGRRYMLKAAKDHINEGMGEGKFTPTVLDELANI